MGCFMGFHWNMFWFTLDCVWRFTVQTDCCCCRLWLRTRSLPRTFGRLVLRWLGGLEHLGTMASFTQEGLQMARHPSCTVFNQCLQPGSRNFPSQHHAVLLADRHVPGSVCTRRKHLRRRSSTHAAAWQLTGASWFTRQETGFMLKVANEVLPLIRVVWMSGPRQPCRQKGSTYSISPHSQATAPKHYAIEGQGWASLHTGSSAHC